jgi:hypothetical protein
MKPFSERVGAVPPRKNIQIEDMDESLKNSLWNVIYLFYGKEETRSWMSVATSVAQHVCKVPVDKIGGTEITSLAWLRDVFFEGPWHQAYEIIEQIYQDEDLMSAVISSSHHYRRLTYNARDRFEGLKSDLNTVLERELSGYRFISDKLSPITSPVEVAAIERAVIDLGVEEHLGAREHLLTALEFLGKKPMPDYRNSIKESISSIEAIVNRIAGTNGNGVSVALDRISEKFPMHRALKASFKSLYGYTSDENGIRHSILEESSIGYEEAAFMLVACSAFASFLIAKSIQLVDG